MPRIPTLNPLHYRDDTPYVRLLVNLEPEVKKALLHEAIDQNRTVSEVVSRLVETYIMKSRAVS